MRNVEVESFHDMSDNELFSKYDSSPSGLDNKVVEKSLEEYGQNILEARVAQSPFWLFIKQYNSVLIYFLFFASVVSYIFDHALDAYVILAIIFINGIIGFIQEFKAEKAINSLNTLIIQKSRVLRNGEVTEIDAKFLVPGDVILLQEGDNVPADARIIEFKNFKTVEASLTGESYPIEKTTEKLDSKTVLAERKNMVFMGTFVAAGTAKAIVVATGSATELGKIAKNLKNIKVERSHFEKKTDRLAKQMAVVAFIGGLITFLVGYYIRGIDFIEIFIFTIAAVVSAIPEGLPAVLVIVLAVGTHRMAKRNAIIRRLPATETLGVVNVIMTDKTGTLTQNVMTVTKVLLFGEKDFEVSGNGYVPEGKFRQDKTEVNPLEIESGLPKLLMVAAVCNSAKLQIVNKEHKSMGDPTEVALLVLAEKAGIDVKKAKSGKKVLDDLSFNSEVKFRATLYKDSAKSEAEIFAVGAPESLLERCSHIIWGGKKVKLTAELKSKVNQKIAELSSDAMRVLALASGPTKNNSSIEVDDVKGLVFLGMTGIIDPPRESVYEAIEKAKNAGIRVLMATGDHQNTALSIGKQIGLTSSNLAYNDTQLSEMSDAEFDKAILKVDVFARLTPDMKLRILTRLQAKGYVVAMTGDGVNDAPALRKADIGIAMGITGTDVARESSEMVLADDNFSSIINAIEEGRIVFNNTRQTSTFLITTNFAEIITILGTLAIGLPLPLIPIQILWLNLVTDTVASLALIMEPSHGDVLSEPPRKKNDNILGRDTIPFLALMTTVMGIATIAVFKSMLPDGIDKARTGAFLVMALTQIFNMLNMRSLTLSTFKIGFTSNKYLDISLVASVVLLLVVMYVPVFQNVFSFVSLSFKEFMVIFGISSSVLIVGEAYKLIKSRWQK